MKIDAAGLVQLVDTLGGVDVDLSEEVDDPNAGSVYLPAGAQTLTGEGALTLARATNFSSPRQTQAENQRKLLEAVSLRMVSGGKSSLVGLLDQLQGAFGTDMGSSDALSLAESLKGMSTDSVTGALVPGYVTQSDGQNVFAVSNSSWTEMMDRVDSGQEPAEQTQAATTDPRKLHHHAEKRRRHHGRGGIHGVDAHLEGASRSRGRATPTPPCTAKRWSSTTPATRSRLRRPCSMPWGGSLGAEHRRLFVRHRCAGYPRQRLETIIVTPSKRPMAPSDAVVESLMMNKRPKGKGEPHGREVRCSCSARAHPTQPAG